MAEGRPAGPITTPATPHSLLGWMTQIARVASPVTATTDLGHHAALAYDDIPTFMAELRVRPAVAARALEFTILTAYRTCEILGAVWDEIDFEKKLWTIPASRMKAAKEHRVPLSRRSMEIVAAMRENGTEGLESWQ